MVNKKNWKELALNRKAWNNLIEKAKPHKVLEEKECMYVVRTHAVL